MNLTAHTFRQASIALAVACVFGFFANKAKSEITINWPTAPTPPWSLRLAEEACSLLRQGIEPEEAGYQAALIVGASSTELANAMLKAQAEDNFDDSVINALMQTCADALSQKQHQNVSDKFKGVLS